MNLQRILMLSAHVFSANVLGGILVILQPMIVIAVTDAYTFGVLSILISWLNVGILLGSVGMFSTLNRYGARYSLKSDYLEHAFHTWADKHVVKNIIITICIITVLSLSIHYSQMPVSFYLLILIGVPLLFYTRWLILKSRIKEKVFWPSFFDQPLREGLFLLIFPIPLVIGAIAKYFDRKTDFFLGEITPSYLMYSYVFAALLAFISVYFYALKNDIFINQNGSSRSTQSKKNRLKRYWLFNSLTVFPSELSLHLLKRIDVIIVGATLSTVDAGMYFLCSRLAEIPSVVSGSLNFIIGPEFSKLNAQKNFHRQRTIYLVHAAFSTFVTISFGIFIFLLDHFEVLNSLIGAKVNFNILYILIGGYIIYFAIGPTTLLLTMIGKQNISSSIGLAILPIHLILVYIFTNQFGLTGTATAFCISICLQKISEVFCWFIFVYKDNL